jgi:hypothetical protein
LWIFQLNLPVFSGSVTFQLKYLIGVFDLWKFEQRTTGTRLTKIEESKNLEGAEKDTVHTFFTKK